jgi:hypothetical protein
MLLLADLYWSMIFIWAFQCLFIIAFILTFIIMLNMSILTKLLKIYIFCELVINSFCLFIFVIIVAIFSVLKFFTCFVIGFYFTN